MSSARRSYYGITLVVSNVFNTMVFSLSGPIFLSILADGRRRADIEALSLAFLPGRWGRTFIDIAVHSLHARWRVDESAITRKRNAMSIIQLFVMIAGYSGLWVAMVTW